MLLEIPPKLSVSSFMGFLKGKSSIMIYERWGDMKYNIGEGSFGAEAITLIQRGKTLKRFKSIYKTS